MAVSKNFVVKKGLEVGGDTLFANSVTDRVGIGTTNPTSTLTVKGNTSLETLTVSGISTFNSNALFNSNIGIGTTNPTSALTVSGNVLVVGVSTFKNTVEVATGKSISFGDAGVGDLKLYTDGSNSYIDQRNTDKLIVNAGGNRRVLEITDLQESLTMAKFTGHGGSVELYYNNSKKIETSGLGVTVTGVTSTTYLYATGISTFIDGPVFIGSAVTTGTALQRLQVTGGGYFSGSVGIGITNPSNTLTVAGSGTSTAQLYVVGFSTFVGYSTFRDYVNIEDGLNVSGVSTFVGYSTFRDYVNIEDGVYVAGVSTFVGYSTFRDYVNIEDGLYVSGISTFIGAVGIGTDIITSQLDVRGTVNLAYDDNSSVGIGSTSIDITSSDINVTNSNINITSFTSSNITIQDGGIFTVGVDALLVNSTVGSVFNRPIFIKRDPDLFQPALISVGISTTEDSDCITLFYENDGPGATPGVGGTGILSTTNGDLKILTDTSSNVVIGSKDIIFTNLEETQERVRIKSSGNVGIGSTNPTSKLTVSGNVNISGIVTAPTFVGNLTGTATTATTVDILNTNGLSTLYYPTFVESRTDGQIVRADVDLTYRTDDNVLTVPNIQLSSSGLTVGTGGTVITTTSGGRVGVGTINPVSKLSVVGGDASVGINTSQGIILTSANGTRYRLFVENDGTLKTVAV